MFYIIKQSSTHLGVEFSWGKSCYIYFRSSSFYHWTEWDIYACQYSTKGHFRIWMFVPYFTFVTLARPSPLPHWTHLGWVGHIAVRWRSGQLQPGFKAKRRVKFGEVKFGSVRVKTYRLIRDTARLHGPLGRLISLWWDLVRIRVQLCKGTEDLPRKVWTRTKILSPKLRYFVAISWFVAIYALFGRPGTRKVLF